jgi:hypothetical protein
MKKEYDFSKAKRGAAIPQAGKTRITIYLDDDVIQDFRGRADEEGRGYQTMMNEALREYLGRAGHPLDEEALRRILREEFDELLRTARKQAKWAGLEPADVKGAIARVRTQK